MSFRIEHDLLGEFEVPTQRFASVPFDPSESKNLEDVSSASARQLMDYRNKVLIEEQRSLDNVTEETWGLRYRAQQRSIKALALALKLKAAYLELLSDADD